MKLTDRWKALFTLWYYCTGGLCSGVNVQICIRSRTITIEWFGSGACRNQIQHLQYHGTLGGLRVFRKYELNAHSMILCLRHYRYPVEVLTANQTTNLYRSRFVLNWKSVLPFSRGASPTLRYIHRVWCFAFVHEAAMSIHSSFFPSPMFPMSILCNTFN